MAFDLAQETDLGHLARWAVSSHKYGFSVANLRDGNDETFWQSEGPQPHWIDLAFPKRVMLSSIQIQCLHDQDDSYTPSKISISAGTSTYDLVEIRQYEFDKPNGWIPVPLRPIIIDDPSLSEPISDSENPMAGKIEVAGPPVPAFYLRVQIMQNHLNGKDTHVRGLRVFGVSGTGIPLSQRVTLPVLISYSSSNKPHDPRHPTSQTTAVTRKSTLVHGSSVVYSSTKGVSERFAKVQATVEREMRERAEKAGKEGAGVEPGREGAGSPRAIHPPFTPSLREPDDSSQPPLRPAPASAPMSPQSRSESDTPPRPTEPVIKDPLADPEVREALRIMEWGDDGLGEYTSLEMRMHRGIR